MTTVLDNLPRESQRRVRDEAITEIPTPDPDHPSSCLDVGNFIGGQNIAANLAVPEPSTMSLLLGPCGVVLAYQWRKRAA
jgi:hypothetical protein